MQESPSIHRHAGAGKDNPAHVPTAAQERALDFLHASALQHVVLADRKAGILFTLLSGALLFLFTRMPDAGWPIGWVVSTWLVVVGLLLSASVLAFLVVLPRLRHGPGSDPLFWGAVAKHTQPENYLAEICETDAAALARAKAIHGYQLSCICARKFRLLRAALLCAAAGLLLFLAALAVGLPPGGLQAGVS
ncbi:Pycsar system effector family protein [Rhodovibrio sodomensis]|uniref:Pycsar system effector family protein n=1 Tax=Rhodovibrio sodomensis TaxID=1088 RepID=UPI0019062525|nr:Pycsar system effector family protein [Rhodovibrio sodomensis]